MSQTTTRTATTPTAPSPSTGSDVATSRGTTTIADAVVSKIAGIATREVTGVHAVGGGAARAVGALRERIPGASRNHSQGISVEVGEKEAAVDVELIAEYGVAIADLAAGVRRNVIGSVERMTGLQVVEVNVVVSDVFIPSEDDDEEPAAPRQPRVQ